MNMFVGTGLDLSTKTLLIIIYFNLYPNLFSTCLWHVTSHNQTNVGATLCIRPSLGQTHRSAPTRNTPLPLAGDQHHLGTARRAPT